MLRKLSLRALGTVIAVSLAATALTGCSAQSPTDVLGQPVDDATSAAEYSGLEGVIEEYNSAAAQHALPDGYSYPKSPFDDSNGAYQQGVGATAAVMYWNCAWGRTYLAAQGVDAVAAGAALNEFAAIQDTDAYRLYFDAASAYPLFDEAIANGQLGDPSGVQLLVNGGCPAE